MLALENKINSVTLVPEQLCQFYGKAFLNPYKVYYISDLHLDTWYVEFGAPSGLSFEAYVESVVDALFSGEFLKSIRTAERFIVLFLGDISESLKSSEMFYSAFISKWDSVDNQTKENYEFLISEKSRLESENSADLRFIEDYKYASRWYRQMDWETFVQSPRLRSDIRGRLTRIRERATMLKEHRFRYIFAPRFADRNLFAVVGNHEMAEFCGKSIIDFQAVKKAEELINSCYSVYESLFNKLDIRFLHPGTECAFSTGPLISQEFTLAGLCGYSNPNLYNVFGNIEEIYGKRLYDWYMRLVSIAKENHSVLLMCSHFPLHAGVVSKSEILRNNIYYFCGHTHCNGKEFLSDTSAIISDNQIGYAWNSKSKFQMKCVCLCDKYNPYAELDDGIYKVSVDSYVMFCEFCCQYINSTRMLTKYVEHGCTFWLAKSEGYYGFFLENAEKRKIYIVNGASVRAIKYAKSIYGIAYRFDDVVQMYIRVFRDIRDYQVNIADFIRSFGGCGFIHGLIVDIDYYNHIGVNPITGELDFYYSPDFGVKKSYADISSLLKEQSLELYDRYCQALSSGTNLPAVAIQHSYLQVDEFIDVPRGGDSFYGASRYMNPIHALFDAHILKVWDEKFIFKVISKEDSHSLPAVTPVPE